MACMNKVVLFDGMNLIHRARTGFAKGPHALTFSFFRGLKPLMEKFKPDIAYFVLEGRPKHRNTVMEDYKANRPKAPDGFWRQQGEILQVMHSLPIVQIRHPDYECDDVIANLAKHYTEAGDDVTIVSNDSDFIQVFDNMPVERLRIWNPMKKHFVQNPDYNYLEWKSLKGDSCDNIPGIKGVGDKTATKLIHDRAQMEAVLSEKNHREIFNRNKKLIAFHWFDNTADDLQHAGAEVIYPEVSLDNVYSFFQEFGFSSLLKESYWSKFKKAFSQVGA